VNIIDGTVPEGRGPGWHPYAPATGVELPSVVHDATDDDVAAAGAAAVRAFTGRDDDPRATAPLLARLADLVDAHSDALVDIAAEETGLAGPRLAGEVARTSGQLRLLAEVTAGGERLDLVIDTAVPAANRPDLRRMQLPLGPVAVFEASNFPLAFGVLGGDTAAALAAGCPVVVKAHPAHPGTAYRCGQLAAEAVAELGLDPGWFALLQGRSFDVGTALVRDPRIAAVAFTGSLSGGRALFDAAASRPDPIPVFAEMGAINPTFVLPGAAQGRVDELAGVIVGALTGSAGQLCTKPGLVIVPDGEEGETLAAALAAAFAQTEATPMLTPGMRQAFGSQSAHSAGLAGVQVLARQRRPDGPGFAEAGTLLRAGVEAWLGQPELRAEHFGPFGVVVCATAAERERILAGLDGTLAAAVFVPVADPTAGRDVVRRLSAIAGRVVVDGAPTGLPVGRATFHGGPWPATTTARDTSVGTAAIDRFRRGVCYQNASDMLLPDPLRDANPLGLPRWVDGRYTADAVRRP
jgi:alpha-ketoglutaric semialdehyde dehydrogenase